MGEYCVCCGASMPSESNRHICRTCELTGDIQFMRFDCPECGKPLDIYYKRVNAYEAPLVADQWRHLNVDLIYHCHNCGCDWYSNFIEDWGDQGQSALRRHYWG